MKITDWNLFWTAFGAIGGTLGGFATCLAVIVALWQTKYENRKKLKLSKLESIKSMNTANGHVEKEFVGVRVCNIGNRAVSIKSWGFKATHKETILLLPDSSPLAMAIQPSLPYRLETEESINLVYDKSHFDELVKRSCQDGTFKPRHKIKIWVADSTGACYYTKTPFTAQYYSSAASK